MPKIIVKTDKVQRVTFWVDSKQWKRFSKVVDNKSESLRGYIDRVISRNLDIVKGSDNEKI